MADYEPTLRMHQEHTLADGRAVFDVMESVVPDKGTLEIEVCHGCHFVFARCTHQYNDWYDAKGNKLEREDWLGKGVTLKCRLCGVDGT